MLLRVSLRLVDPFLVDQMFHVWVGLNFKRVRPAAALLGCIWLHSWNYVQRFRGWVTAFR